MHQQFDHDGNITPGSVPTVYVSSPRSRALRRARQEVYAELEVARLRIAELEEMVAILSDKLVICAEKLARSAEKK